MKKDMQLKIFNEKNLSSSMVSLMEEIDDLCTRGSRARKVKIQKDFDRRVKRLRELLDYLMEIKGWNSAEEWEEAHKLRILISKRSKGPE